MDDPSHNYFPSLYFRCPIGITYRGGKFEDQGGNTLLKYYTSLPHALRVVYPDFAWDTERHTSPDWGDIQTSRSFLQRVGRELGVNQVHCYTITLLGSHSTPSDVSYELEGGLVPCAEQRGRAARRRTWVLSALRDARKRATRCVSRRALGPDEVRRRGRKDTTWQVAGQSERHEGARRMCRAHHWDCEGSIVLSIKPHTQGQHHVSSPTFWYQQQPEDWYTVTLADLRQAGMPYALSKLELAELLSEKYPEQKWEKVHMLRGKFAQQKRLERAVAALFPV